MTKQESNAASINDIFDHDLKIMPDHIKWAWIGRLFTMWDTGHIQTDDYHKLLDRLDLDKSKEENIYDALAGGITERP